MGGCQLAGIRLAPGWVSTRPVTGNKPPVPRAQLPDATCVKVAHVLASTTCRSAGDTGTRWATAAAQRRRGPVEDWRARGPNLSKQRQDRATGPHRAPIVPGVPGEHHNAIGGQPPFAGPGGWVSAASSSRKVPWTIWAWSSPVAPTISSTGTPLPSVKMSANRCPGPAKLAATATISGFGRCCSAAMTGTRPWEHSNNMMCNTRRSRRGKPICGKTLFEPVTPTAGSPGAYAGRTTVHPAAH